MNNPMVAKFAQSFNSNSSAPYDQFSIDETALDDEMRDTQMLTEQQKRALRRRMRTQDGLASRPTGAITGAMESAERALREVWLGTEPNSTCQTREHDGDDVGTATASSDEYDSVPALEHGVQGQPPLLRIFKRVPRAHFPALWRHDGPVEPAETGLRASVTVQTASLSAPLLQHFYNIPPHNTQNPYNILTTFTTFLQHFAY